MNRRRMAFYTAASTANPTGWRPWNSRLNFYIPNTFPVPTTGRGPWLLQPGAPNARPAAAGGLAGISFPNYAGFQGNRNWRTQVNPRTAGPIYGPPPGVRASLSGLGAAIMPASAWRKSAARVNAPAAASGTTSTTTPTNTTRRRRQNQNQNQSANYEGWSSQNPRQSQSYQQYQQTQGQNGGISQTSAAGTIVGYDASGNPIYSSAPSGLVVTGTDAQGNPIYGAAGSTAAATSTGSSFFSEDSLGLGLNNAWYLGIGVGLVLIFKKR